MIGLKNVRKLMFVINPKSGTRSAADSGKAIVELAESLTRTSRDASSDPYDIEVRFTERPGHATELAAMAASEGYYAVVACGGDGTVNEVARGLRDSGTALGIIPIGSGNGLARHLGIPMTLRGAFGVISGNRIINADYASANSRPFFCTFGVGFDAEVTEKFNLRPERGLKNYILTVLEEYSHYQSDTYTIMANGKRITEKALIVAVCNASQYGNNAYIAPEASIKDGLLDITIVHSGSVIENTFSAIDMLSGLIGKTAGATTFKASEIRIIRNHEGPAHFDGEPAIMPKLIDVKCHPGQLKVFSNPKKSRMRALMAPEIPILSPLILTARDLRYQIHNLIAPR